MNCIKCNSLIIKANNIQADIEFEYMDKIHYTNPYLYLCPKCGLFQLYANEDFIDNISKDIKIKNY